MNLLYHASGERDYITMRTMTVVRQYLAAAFLIVIGSIAYGCGDSATVNPEATLANLTVNTGAAPATLQPSFNPAATSYTVDLSNNVTSATVSAQPAVSGDNVTIDGQATTSRVIDLGQPVPAGSTTLVNITVSDPPNTPRTYTVLLRRAALDGNNSLQSLNISPGTLAPIFNANTQSYTVDVANNMGSVTVTPALQDTDATMTVNGQPTTSGQARTVTLNGAGQPTAIPIVVTAQNGNQKTYTITVSRGISSNSNLQSLTISPGTLAPTFNANEQIYTANVANTVGSVSVTPTRQDATATITVNGQATNSGQGRTITLNPAGQSQSTTTILILVTAQNGSQKAYTVNVNRAALGGNNNLSGLTVSPGPLDDPFNANDLSYTVNVASTVTSITVTPTRQDPNATITLNGTPATSGQGRSIPLNGAGSNTLINILVTAPNGLQKTYTVNVNRAALGGNNNLSSLTVSPGPLTPAFTATTTNYTVNVASGVNSMTVTPTLQATTASMTVNGQATNSGQARTITPLNPAGQTTTIPIVVTAQNGSQKTYTVNVNRAALGGNDALQSLTVSPGTLSPVFSVARTLPYTVSDVSSSATTILVTATPQDPSATVTINNQGGNSRSITLPGGPSSTEIVVLVIAPNGNDRTYLITVNQPAPAAPPAPTSAPDLIAEDDSCEPGIPDPAVCAPGTSKDDNVTNVTTPSFAVAQPAAGETPTLYVDGSIAKQGFDSGANTLTPTAALSDGVHTITSTVTNAGGLESPQSPSLTVTIDTVAPGP
jgi:Cadherin-like beta sandwich domain/Bacterial Ig-like domain